MDLPTLAGIEEAEGRIRPHLAETPLLRSEILSRAMNADVWLKLETVSPIASFKLRGALAVLSRAQEASGLSSACTSSTGNHGQGVAYAARHLGLAAEIFMPEAPNPVKQAMASRRPGRCRRSTPSSCPWAAAPLPPGSPPPPRGFSRR
jgi:threonine dehydratase